MSEIDIEDMMRDVVNEAREMPARLEYGSVGSDSDLAAAVEVVYRYVDQLRADLAAARADAERLAAAAGRAHSLLSTIRLVGSVTMNDEQREVYQSVESDLVAALAAHQRGEG